MRLCRVECTLSKLLHIEVYTQGNLPSRKSPSPPPRLKQAAAHRGIHPGELTFKEKPRLKQAAAHRGIHPGELTLKEKSPPPPPNIKQAAAHCGGETQGFIGVGGNPGVYWGGGQPRGLLGWGATQGFIGVGDNPGIYWGKLTLKKKSSPPS